MPIATQRCNSHRALAPATPAMPSKVDFDADTHSPPCAAGSKGGVITEEASRRKVTRVWAVSGAAAGSPFAPRWQGASEKGNPGNHAPKWTITY